jgi:mannose-6-phosphate isomerase-like protein (cupin superfamily)
MAWDIASPPQLAQAGDTISNLELHEGNELMPDFPDFMRNAANRIALASQFTDDIEGYLFDGADGNQVAFWKSNEDRTSAEHAHPFDEYVLVVEGQAIVIVGEQRTVLGAGQEMVIPKGTKQSMAVRAGTRTIHVFGGRRAARAHDVYPP